MTDVPVTPQPKEKKRGTPPAKAKCLAWIRKQGWRYGKTELPFNPYSKKRQDLFGLWDYEALGIPSMEVYPYPTVLTATEAVRLRFGQRRIIGIQLTDGKNLAAHQAKLAEPKLAQTLAEWKEAGGLGLILYAAKVRTPKMHQLTMDEFMDPTKMRLSKLSRPRWQVRQIWI